jgi:hypothetical protein
MRVHHLGSKAWNVQAKDATDTDSGEGSGRGPRHGGGSNSPERDVGSPSSEREGQQRLSTGENFLFAGVEKKNWEPGSEQGGEVSGKMCLESYDPTAFVISEIPAQERQRIERLNWMKGLQPLVTDRKNRIGPSHVRDWIQGLEARLRGSFITSSYGKFMCLFTHLGLVTEEFREKMFLKGCLIRWDYVAMKNLVIQHFEPDHNHSSYFRSLNSANQRHGQTVDEFVRFLQSKRQSYNELRPAEKVSLNFISEKLRCATLPLIQKRLASLSTDATFEEVYAKAIEVEAEEKIGGAAERYQHRESKGRKIHIVKGRQSPYFPKRESGKYLEQRGPTRAGAKSDPCYTCGKAGHYARDCREKTGNSRRGSFGKPGGRPRNVQWLQKGMGENSGEEDAAGGDRVFSIYNTFSKSAKVSGQIKAHVRVGQDWVQATLDTGADLSIISESVLRKMQDGGASVVIIEESGLDGLDDVQVRGIMGCSQISPKYFVKIPMSFGYGEVPLHFAVFGKEVNCKLLLGVDALKAQGVILDIANMCGYVRDQGCPFDIWHDGEKPRNKVFQALEQDERICDRQTTTGNSRRVQPWTLYASEDLVLPSFCQSQVEVQTGLITSEMKKSKILGFCHAEDRRAMKHRVVAAASANYLVEGKTVITVANMAQETFYAPKGTALAVFVRCEQVFRSGKKTVLVAKKSAPSTVVPQERIREEVRIENLQLTESQKEEIYALLGEFPEVILDADQPLPRSSIICHEIDTGTSLPISVPPHRVSPAERQVIEQEIERLLNRQVIEPSESPWAAPVVMVPKPNGKWRFCVDYRKLNAVTRKDSYPITRIDDALSALSGNRFFSSLDLPDSFWSIPVKESDVPKTAFICHAGLFQFTRMPMGMSNSGSVFQRAMDAALSGLKWKVCICYIDDIIVFSKTFQEHKEHLRLVLGRLKAANLCISLSKCFFVSENIRYLGHVVSAEGVRPDPGKVNAVKQWPSPSSKGEVQSFLGLTSYYRKFIPNHASISAPLRQLIKTETRFVWDQACEDAFQRLKELLMEEPLLKHPQFDMPFIVYCDASLFGLGAVLAQDIDGEIHPIAYASRALLPAEAKWHIRELEALAIIWSCEYFRPYIYGSKFKVVTDHSSLQWLMSVTKPGRLSRWALRLQEYDFEIEHRAGKLHSNCDALSRRPQEATAVEIMQVTRRTSARESTIDWAPEQNSDDLCLAIKRLISAESASGSSGADRELGANVEKAAEAIDNKCTVREDILYFVDKNLGERIFVPSHLVKRILEANHGSLLSGHQGIAKTTRRVIGRFFWPGVRAEVKRFVVGCTSCGRHKTSAARNRPGLLQPIEVTRANEVVSIDFFGPLTKSVDGKEYVLTMVDFFTRWVVTVAVTSTKAKALATKFIEEWVCRYGIPRFVVSDRGVQFVQSIFQCMVQSLGVQHNMSAPYHHQANSRAEKYHDYLGPALAQACEDKAKGSRSGISGTWTTVLSGVTFAYNTSFVEVIGTSPFYLTFGRHPDREAAVLRGGSIRVTKENALNYGVEVVENLRRARGRAEELQRAAFKKMKAYYDKNRREIELAEGDYVMVERHGETLKKHEPSFKGPFVIGKKIDARNYMVSDPATGREYLRNIQSIVPYFPYEEEIVELNVDETEDDSVDDSSLSGSDQPRENRVHVRASLNRNCAKPRRPSGGSGGCAKPQKSMGSGGAKPRQRQRDHSEPQAFARGDSLRESTSRAGRTSRKRVDAPYEDVYQAKRTAGRRFPTAGRVEKFYMG